jgi:predicted RNase H-like HicB family nuclease
LDISRHCEAYPEQVEGTFDEVISFCGTLYLSKKLFWETKMSQKYTAIVRKSGTQYLAVCLELNLVAQGNDLPEVEKNLRDAIEMYIEEISTSPETVVEPIPIQEFIEFLNDTEPEPSWESSEEFILKPLEVHEVARYA